MHTAVKLELDKTSALELPAFEPEELDYWINKAINVFVDTRYSGFNIKRESLEQTQKLTEDLKTLVKEVRAITLTAGGTTDKPNSYLVTMSTTASDYRIKMDEEVEITFTVPQTGIVITKRQGITECTSDSYRTYIDNPYSEHRLHYMEAKPLRLFKNNTVELISDGTYTITKYFLKYIKNPAVVSIISTPNVSCDLPLHTHRSIVNIVVTMLLENIESIRHQTFRDNSEVDISIGGGSK